MLGKSADLQQEQELACELAQVGSPDVEVVAVVSQCSRQADICRGPGYFGQAATQAIVT